MVIFLKRKSNDSCLLYVQVFCNYLIVRILPKIKVFTFKIYVVKKHKHNLKNQLSNNF